MSESELKNLQILTAYLVFDEFFCRRSLIPGNTVAPGCSLNFSDPGFEPVAACSDPASVRRPVGLLRTKGVKLDQNV